MDPTSPETPLLDFHQLNTMIDLGLESYLDLLDGVIQSVPDYLTNIHTDILTGNHQNLDHNTHALRGMLSYFGCIALCTRLDDFRITKSNPTSPPAEQAGAIHAGLMALWEATFSAIKAWEKTVPEFQSEI
jgi:hypothetical protein